MTWLILIAVLAAGLVVLEARYRTAMRALAEARRIADDVKALADRQLTHEVEIRWLRHQVRPEASRNRWPFPAHLTRVTPSPAQDPNQALWGATHLKENQP